MKDERVGFVGLGAMGHRMVRRLIASGRKVIVYDTREGPISEAMNHGAEAAGSPEEVANVAETVLVSLPTPDVVRVVASGPNGIIKGKSIRTFVDLSTTGPIVAEELAGAFAEAGVGYVDAPVSGGTVGAEAGSLAIMVAGEENAITSVRPLLDVLGRVFVVGLRPGQGQVAKVANNLLSASAITITAEALTLGVKAGLNPQVLLDVFNAGSGKNTATSDKFPRAVLTGTFNIGFKLELMAKDLRLCLAEAHRQQVPMIVGSVLEQLWSLAELQGSVGDDCMTLVQLLEAWAGVRIESPVHP